MLVLCEVLNAGGHEAARRRTPARRWPKVAKKYAKQEMIFGIEQEYTMLKPNGTPLGFPDGGGFPGPQGPYYCGVGTGRVIGREIIEEHTQACIDAGLMIEGTNAEVMPGQWEFQIGAADALTVSDHLYVARWLLHRIAEDYDVIITFAAKPEKGDWNGAGAHTNFSTKAMREGYDAIEAACEAIGKKRRRSTSRATAPTSRAASPAPTRRPRTTSSATACPNRGASIRIPWQVAKDGKGYAEDRRPNANCDPYTVTRLILESVCRRLIVTPQPTGGSGVAGAPCPLFERPRTDQTAEVTEVHEQQRDYVLHTVEERGVRLIRLWFTDVLGNLKSFAISPAELENALEDGMTFDGSSIDGFSRIQESDVLAIPDAEHVRGAAVGRPKAHRGPGVLRHPQPRRHARSRAIPARCCGATCSAAHERGLHVLRRPGHGVLLLRPAGSRASRRCRSTRAGSSTSPPPTCPARCASRPSARSRR